MPPVQTRLLVAFGALGVGVTIAAAYYYTLKQRKKREDTDEGIGDEDSIISDSEDPTILRDLTTPVTIAPNEHGVQFKFDKDPSNQLTMTNNDMVMGNKDKDNGSIIHESAEVADKSSSLSNDDGISEDSTIKDNKPKKVLILGLDGSGKTALIETLTKQQDRKSVDYTPTNGFNVAQYRQGDVFFNFMEVGGGENSRPYWPNFLENTDLLIFVIDGNDSSRFSEAKIILRDILSRDILTKTPCLLISNKQDLDDSVSCNEIISDEELAGISNKQLKITMMDFVCVPDKQESEVEATVMEVVLNMLQ